MNDFVRVAATADIPEGEMRSFEVNRERVLICHTGEGFFALADECTHDSTPISHGQLFQCEVICPRHGAKFDVRTGAVTGPPAVVPMDKYEVRIEGEDIYVRLD